MSQENSFTNHDNDVCVVAYALNAKKMRASGCYSNNDNPKNINNMNGLSNNSNNQYKESNIFNSINNENENSKKWCGGGLSDILTDKSFQNIQYVPFNINDHHVKYNCIIHKLTEEIDKEETISRIQNIEDYLHANPNCIIIDPFQSVMKVTSRAQTCLTLKRIIEEAKIESFKQPKFVIVNNVNNKTIIEAMKENDIQFPVICKSIKACGTSDSHYMVVAINEEGLSQIRFPCVVQQYHDHDSNFFKVYVIGEDVMLFRRPSLPNLTNINSKAVKNIAFNSRHTYPSIEDFIDRDIFDSFIDNEHLGFISNNSQEFENIEFKGNFSNSFKLVFNNIVNFLYIINRINCKNSQINF